MRKPLVTAVCLAALVAPAGLALAADKLVVSVWGGPWKDLIQNTVAAQFTKETGIPVEYVTGGTVDRLAKAKINGANPESDVTLSTEHIAFLYASDELLLPLDRSKLPSTKTLFPEAVTGSNCLGLFSYVYSIVYRPDLVPGAEFKSWRDLWNPAYKGKVGLPDFDPSHIMVVSAKLSGGDAETWQKGTTLLKDLKPNVRSFYSTDAVSQEKVANGETPIQVMLSGNYYYLKQQGVNVQMALPKEGAVAGVNCIAINKGTKMADAAYKFLDIAFRPDIQGAIAKQMLVGPMTSDAKVADDVAKMPGIFTTRAQWSSAMVIDPKARAKLLPEWRTWFTENMVRK
jgi:putative spermidine/putrescine transport system substrate-binding protein